MFSKKEGKGKYTWADGSTYNGDWVDNKIKGVGTYLWKDGRKCYGEWLDNDMSGYGIFIYQDGVRYEGQFLLDKKEGFGIYKWTDGRIYEGWWYKGKQHGVGSYFDPVKKSLRYGLWENGKRVKWYDSQQQKDIEEKKLDYRKDFTEEVSGNAFPKLVTFSKPPEYDRKIQEIKLKLNVE